MATVRKVTVDLDADILDEFLKHVHMKLGIRKQNLALNAAMQEWMKTYKALGASEIIMDGDSTLGPLDPPPWGNSTESHSEALPTTDTLDAKHGLYHRMLDTILNSGVDKISEAIISNLAAFEAFALVMKEKTSGNTNKPGKPKKDTAANLARANQAALRSAIELEEATASDRRGAKSPHRKTGAA